MASIRRALLSSPATPWRSPTITRRRATDYAGLLLLLSTAAEGQEAPPPATTLVTATAHFALHSDPWINLHHFLYQWARADLGLGSGRQLVTVPERAAADRLTPAQRQTWERALTFYRDAVAGRSHFDPQLVAEQQALLTLGGDPSRAPPDIIPGIAAALAEAMPVYRARWWPAHDRANHAWIATVAPLLRRHEARFVTMTERIYGAQWPASPRRVDVSAYANFRAGYTAEGHTVIYATDPGNQGLYGLETLLHEVQHTEEIGEAARQRLTRAFAAAGVDPPPNLWHAMIFATAGAFVRSVAEREDRPAHVPYWTREGLADFRGWRAAAAAVRAHWLPVVRGEATPQAGVAALVRSVPAR